jgi:nitrile hydratase beta subunit
MNSVHDMGGMQGFGPIRPEKNAPVFHARWEGRITAIYSALGAWGKWAIDFRRQTRESLPPAEYLALNYYQLLYALVVELLAISGMATRAEIEAGRPAKGARKAIPPLTADKVDAWFAAGSSKRRDVAVAPKFQAGQRVRARNINPPTHTRLPRYARGKLGIIERDHGVFVFPDTNAQGLGEKPQHVYSVRFAARELWGEQASPKDTVIVAMWDDYLEAV